MMKQLCFKALTTLFLIITFSIYSNAQNDIIETPSEDIIFITGLMKNADNGELISSKDINFMENGMAVIHTNISESGHYGIAILKDYLEQSADLVIQIDGFKDYVVENIGDLSDYIQLDLTLKEEVPVQIVEKNTVEMNESTTNPFIMRF